MSTLFDSYTDPDISGIFTSVIDNSINTDTIESDRSVLIISPTKFGSTELMKFGKTETLRDVLGEENTFRYGLGQYYARSFIEAGANVIFKRIEDPSATYANNLIYRNTAANANGAFSSAFFGNLQHRDTLLTQVVSDAPADLKNNEIKRETVLSTLATGRGKGYCDLFMTYTPAPDYEKFEADDDGITAYKFNFMYATVYENATKISKKSSTILCSLMDIDPEKGYVIAHKTSGQNLYINDIIEKSNLYLSARINSTFQSELRRFANIDAVLEEKELPFLYIEAEETAVDATLNDSDRIYYEVEVTDKNAFRIQRAVFSASKPKRKFQAQPTFAVEDKVYLLTIKNVNGKLSIVPLPVTTDEITYTETKPAYINGDDAFFTFKLVPDIAGTGAVVPEISPFKFLRWELFMFLKEHNISLDGGKDSTTANAFVNLDGSANIQAISNQIYNYLRDDKEIREVLYPRFYFNYMIDWTNTVKVKDIMMVLADRIKRTMNMAACPSVRLNANGTGPDYSLENDVICREQYLTKSSYNTMLFTSQMNKEHYDEITKLTYKLPSDFYALLNHIYIDLDINYGITEPVANSVKGIIRTQNLNLTHKLYAEDLAELKKYQINGIVTDASENYFLEQFTAYKKQSKLSLGNVVKAIQQIQIVIPQKLKVHLQKKELRVNISGALEELSRILKPYRTNVNSKDAIFSDVNITHSFNNGVLQLLLRVTPVGTTQKIEIPIVVEG